MKNMFSEKREMPKYINVKIIKKVVRLTHLYGMKPGQ